MVAFLAMKVCRYVSNDFTVRASVVNATSVVIEMQKVLNSMPLATVGVGRAMVGALLMVSHQKPDQQVGVLIKGNGPLVSIYAQASFEGHVRGYCPVPHYVAPTNSPDVLNLGKAIGNGLLTVTRDLPFQKQPHHGTVQLQTGQIGDDIAHYLLQSHQIRSLVNVGVYLDTYGQVKAAGGVLIEVMPGVEDDIVNKIQKNSDENKSQVSKLILEGKTESEIVAPYLAGIPWTQIPHDYEISYHCPCTLDRVKDALSLFGHVELNEIAATDPSTEIQCQMCGKKYSLTPDEVKDLSETLRKNSMH
jgi:molecular chaperone Hsp33